MKSFNERVWELTKKIPKGRVSTYKELGRALGIRGYQAIGQALHKNPYNPLVPCHRVVNSKRELHGFALGLKEKKKLLEEEGLEINKKKIVDFENVLYKFLK